MYYDVNQYKFSAATLLCGTLYIWMQYMYISEVLIILKLVNGTDEFIWIHCMIVASIKQCYISTDN